MNQGEVQRWRFINATPALALNLKAGQLIWNEIALDGMYLGTVDTWPANSPLTLQPGNRTDVVIKAPDNCSAGCPPVNLTDDNDEVIATVEFTRQGAPMPLPTSAEMKALKNWKNIDTGSVTTNQSAEFAKSGCDVADTMCVDGKTFINADNPRPLPVNQTQGWNVWAKSTDTGVEHVFHIHVNPFQTIRKGPTGAAEIVWLDTVLIPKESSKDNPVKMWTTYEAIMGKSVFHCHILPHEDKGMMQAIEIKPDNIK